MLPVDIETERSIYSWINNNKCAGSSWQSRHLRVKAKRRTDSREKIHGCVDSLISTALGEESQGERQR